jgi:hypothetical protein
MMSAEANSMFETLHRARPREAVPVEVLGDVSELVEAPLLLVIDQCCRLTVEGLARHEVLLNAWRDSSLPSRHRSSGSRDSSGRRAREGTPVARGHCTVLRAADTRLPGSASGLITPNRSVSGLLLQATLTPDESANDSAESRPPAS